VDLESVTLVLLRWGERAHAFTEEELDALQEQHLAHLDRMRAAGHLLAAGPFEGQPDVGWRGLCLYRVGVEEARRLAEQDPSVLAGRLRVDVWGWFFPVGEIVFPGR
jgi:uncharacterized protein YciI